MKTGICYVCIDEGTTLAAKAAAAREAGYEGIELTVGDGPAAAVLLGMGRPEVERIRRVLHGLDLEIPSVMGTVLRDTPILSPDPEVRRQGVAAFAAVLERAAWLGASTALLHPGQLSPELRYDQAWEVTVEALRALIPACERTGVGIGLENVWNKFLLAPTEMCQLLDEVNHPLIGCYLDTANMLLYGFAEHWVPIVGRHLRKVHVKDFKRQSGGGHFCELLDGDCNYPAVMRELRVLGYDDYLTSEVSATERGPGRSIAETAARLQQIIAM